jgi:predicted dehydrogenase
VGRVIGRAPDTFLGGRWQTCRELLDSGELGKPTGFAVFVGTHGVERHHPNPDFYYQHGGGPLLDLGPYYLSTLVFLLGPMKRVCGMSRRTFDQRLIESQPRHGEMMQVEVDTHVQCMVELTSGVIGSMTISFDIWDSETPRLEVYCENGTICIPDPDPVHGANVFGGEVWYRTRETSRWAYQPRRPVSDIWQKAANRHRYNENSRGLGLLDMAYAIREGRSPRASGVLAHHIDEAMHGILASNHTGSYYRMQTTVQAPAPLPHEFPSKSAGCNTTNE